MQAASKSLRLGLILQKEATTLAFEEFQNSLKKYARIVDLKSVRADADAFKPGKPQPPSPPLLLFLLKET